MFAVSLALIGAASAVDSWAFHHFRLPDVYDRDWGRALRSVGYWPLWIALSVALWLTDRARVESSGPQSSRARSLSPVYWTRCSSC